MEVRDAVRIGGQRLIHVFDDPPELLPGWQVLGVELIVPGSRAIQEVWVNGGSA